MSGQLRRSLAIVFGVVPSPFVLPPSAPPHGATSSPGPLEPLALPSDAFFAVAVLGSLALALYAFARVCGRGRSPSTAVSNAFPWVAVIAAALVIALGTGAFLHSLHSGLHEAIELTPLRHWLRDSLLAAPSAVLAAGVAGVLVVWLRRRRFVTPAAGQMLWALTTAALYSFSLVPGALAHARIFGTEHEAGANPLTHAVVDAATAAPVVLGIALAIVALVGAPLGVSTRGPALGAALLRAALDRGRRPQLARVGIGAVTAFATLAAVIGATPLEAALGLQSGLTSAAPGVAAPPCDATNAVRTYDIQAINLVIPFNRWGDVNRHGQAFVLTQDRTAVEHWAHPPTAGDSRRVRPRPLILRANEGECVKVTLTNNLDDPVALPPGAPPAAQPDADRDGLPLPAASQRASIHVHGAAFSVNDSDGSAVGYNADTTVAANSQRTYYWRAPQKEGLYFFHDHGALAGSEADGGSNANGLYGALAVEPANSQWFDSTSGLELSGTRPYERVSGQSGDLYITAMIKPPAAPAFREIIQISQDEIPGTHLQNCDLFDVAAGRPITRSLCTDAGDEAVEANGVGFDFGLGLGFNYAEEHLELRAAPINRCPDCVSEETWLSSWPYGDPGMVKLGSGLGPWYPTWHPLYPGNGGQQNFANIDVAEPEDCGLADTTLQGGGAAKTSCYTSGVVHSYNGDPTKVRFAHAGPKETHIFHLHAHQWLSDPFDVGAAGANPTRPDATHMPEATTIDSQTFGPGEAFTADMLFGAGSLRNAVGDSIFHCHLYPHFAEGFWALWRVHDVNEAGTLTGTLGRTADKLLVSRLAPLPGRAPLAAPTVDAPGYPRYLPGQYGWRAPQPPNSIWEPSGLPDDTATALIREDLEPAIRMVAGQALDAAYLNQIQTIAKPAGAFTLTYKTTVSGPISNAASAADIATVLTGLGVPGVPVVVDTGTAWKVTFERSASDHRLAPNVRLLEATGGATVSADLAANPVWQQLELEDKNTGGRDAANRDKQVIPGAPIADPCPATAREVNYNVTALQRDIVYNEANWHDPQGRFYVLDTAVADILGGTNPEPFFFRANAGDCINYALANRMPNYMGADDFLALNQTNMLGQHIHLVKFDVTASDGASNGYNYTEAAFTEDQMLFNQSLRDGTTLQSTTSKVGRHGEFAHYTSDDVASCGADSFSGIVLVNNGCRLKNPATFNPLWACSLMGCPLGQTIRERWFADYQLRTVFTHDHHFPAIDQNRGLFGALVVEPAGMDVRNSFSGVYYQPINAAAHGPTCGAGGLTPAEVALLAAQGRPDPSHLACTGSAVGTHLDIIGPGANDDFREYSLAIADFVSLYRPCGGPCPTPTRISGQQPLNPPGEPEVFPQADPGVMAMNYRNAPMVLRNTRSGAPVDPAYWFSSFVHGDPRTPLLRAYSKDPIRVRLIQGSQEEQHVVQFHGLRWPDEPDDPGSPLVNARSLGISEAFNFELPQLDCGVTEDCLGDYLYSGTSSDDLWLGAWGILRVFGKPAGGLLPLPDNIPPAGSVVLPTQTGAPPPAAAEPGTPCPDTAPVRKFNVIATDASITYNEGGEHDPYGLVYAVQLPGETPAQAAARVRLSNPEPMVLHANAGDCIEVTLANAIDPLGNFAVRHAPMGANQAGTGFDPPLPLEPSTGTPAGLRVSLHPSLVKYDVRGSDGATIGFNDDQTVGVGGTIQYRWWADKLATGELGAINLTDYGDFRGHRHHGLFAGLVIHPEGASAHDPLTGVPLLEGAAASRTRAATFLASKGATSVADLAPADRATYLGYVASANHLAAGNQADVRVASQADYRNWTLLFQDGLNLWNQGMNPAVGGAAVNVPDAPDHPPTALEPAELPDAEDRGEKGFNYRNAAFHVRLGIDLHSPPLHGSPFDGLDGAALAGVFATNAQHGDPQTPILRAYAGDPVRVRLLQGADKPRQNSFGLSAHAWYRQPFDDPNETELIGLIGGISVGRAINIHTTAGGDLQSRGDHRYGSNNLFHHQSGGLWGIARIYERPPTATSTFVPSPLAAMDSPYAAGYRPLMPLELLAARVTVFDDRNMNGTREAAEPGLGASTNGDPAITGVEVQLHLIDQTTGEPGAAIGDPAFTDADGVATFTLIPGGAYAARAKLPAGSGGGPSDWAATKFDWSAFTAGTQLDTPTAEIGLVQRGDAKVFVFRDADGSNTQDLPGDTPLTGWSVTLTKGTFTVTKPTASGAGGTVAGEAKFEGLLPGEYIVEIASLEGRTISAPNPKVTVGENTVGELKAGFTLPSGGLQVVLFNDANNNGARDADVGGLPELALAGWRVELYQDGSTTPVASATTDPSGLAILGQPGLGPKFIKVVAPRGIPQMRKATASFGGAAPIVLCGAPAADCDPAGAPITLTSALAVANIAVHSNTAWVGPELFNDSDNDGLRDALERRLVGWPANVYAGTIPCPTPFTTPLPTALGGATVGNDGRATFSVDLTGVFGPATFTVCVRQPSDSEFPWRRTPNATMATPSAADQVALLVTLLPGDTRYAVTGFIQLGTIQADVFDDTDANAENNDYDAPLPGRIARLRDQTTLAILAQKATNDEGLASFMVSAGENFLLEVLLPTGWGATTPLGATGDPTTHVAVTSSADPAQSVYRSFGQTNRTGLHPSLPVASPSGGTFTSTQSVVLTSNAGAAIYYTLDGSTPTPSSPRYLSSIAVDKSLVLKAIAVNSFGSSGVAAFSYTVTPPTPTVPAVPTANPPAGTYSDSISVTLSSLGATKILYTLDGTAPKTATTSTPQVGVEYTGPISVNSPGKLIRAIGVNAVGSSPIANFGYLVGIIVLPPGLPTASPAPLAGGFPGPQTVTLNPGANTVAIRYTTNGSDPTTASPLYSSPIAVNASMTIKAIGINSEGVAGAVATFAYVINGTAPQGTAPAPWIVQGAGSILPGTEGNTLADDGAFMVLSSTGITIPRRIAVEASGTVTRPTVPSVVSGVALRYSGSATASGVTRTLRMWNFNTSAWETVNTLVSEVLADGAPATYQAPGDASRFVGPTGQVRVRLETSSSVSHQLRVDYVSVNVTFKSVAPSINGTPPTPVLMGQPYSFAFTVAGAPAPVVSLASGVLPTGLVLSAAGVLSGTPTTAGSFQFAVKATNGVAPDAVTPTLTIVVQVMPDLVITTELKAGQPAPRAGGTLAYVLRVRNAGNLLTPPPPANVTLIDTLPPGTTLLSWGFRSGSGSCSADSSGRLRCDLGARMVPGAETVIEVVIRTPKRGTLVNTAEVDPFRRITESNEANNLVLLSTVIP